jgi:hypothetical protein
MALWEFVDQKFEVLDPFQLGKGVEGGLFEKGKILLDDIIAKGMESMDMDFIGVGAYKCQQTAAHGDGSGIRISETKNVFGKHVRLQEYFPDPGSQYLSFTRSRSCDYHDGAFGGIYGQSLLFIQFPIFFAEMLLKFLPVNGHTVKVRYSPGIVNPLKFISVNAYFYPWINPYFGKRRELNWKMS